MEPVRRPFALEQVRSNLKLARRFLAELRKIDPTAPIEPILGLLDTIEEQLKTEIDFRKEATRIAQAQKFYAKMNHEMKKELGGWRFRVPGLAEGFSPHENLLVLERAQGETFDAIPDETTREHVGSLLARSSLLGLFRHGFFDPDRHKGNQLIDLVNKVISPIDFGQAETMLQDSRALAEDDGYRLAQFLKSAGAGAKADNSDAIVASALRFSEAKEPPPTARVRLKETTRKLFRGGKVSESGVIELMHAFSEEGVPWHRRFSVGALKGLLTLRREAYVPEVKFDGMVGDEVRHALLRKPWLTLRESRFMRCALGLLAPGPRSR